MSKADGRGGAAPSHADEDVTGGFAHGGWHTRYFDDLSMQWVIDNVRGVGGYRLGRGTYEIFAAHWPGAPEEQQVLAQPLNALPKYLISPTLGTSRSAGRTRGCCTATPRPPYTP